MEINGVYYCSRCMRRLEGEGPCPHCGYDGTQERDLSVLEEGTLLNGKYQLGAVIGQGGFGITYAAWDENLDRAVAVKEYFPSDFVTRNTDVSDEAVCLEKYRTVFLEGRLRFEREGRLLAALQEIPNVVKVLDYFSENNTAYIVMEYIHGVPLDKWIAGKKLKPGQVLQVMRPVADALALLHRQGVVHRDLKPDNMLVEEDGAIRLIDFGAAMQAEQHGSTIILSRGYAPVEQYGKEYGRQGPWSDVYGLAAVIYELLTGDAPQEALLRAQRDEMRSPAALGIRLHKKQNAALMAALAVQPEKRTQSMEEFRAGLYLLPMPEQVLWRKRMQRRVFSAFAVILLIAALIAANFTVGLPLGHGLLYSLRKDGWHILREWRSQAQRELPGSLLGLPVTAVERDAFRGDEALEQVTLPPSVRSLGDQVFYACPNLNTVHLNEDLKEIGLNAFDGAAENLLIWGRRNGTQEVYAQSNCLLFVDGSEMVFEEMGDGLILTECNSPVEKLVIPSYVNEKPVVEIGETVKIKIAAEVYFPDELTALPAGICEGNDNLKIIHVGKHTKQIGAGAFQKCGQLSVLYFGEALQSVGDSAFCQCSSLTDIFLPEGVVELGENVFSKCTSLRSFFMPDSVEKAGNSIFSHCSALQEIRLSEALKEIPRNAFQACGFTTIRLPRSIRFIGNGAFRESSLEWLSIPAGVRMLEAEIFASCTSLKWVQFLCDDAELTEGSMAYTELTGFPDDLVIGGHSGTVAEWIAAECGAEFVDINGWSDGFELVGECAVLKESQKSLWVPWFNEKENCLITHTKGVSGSDVQIIILSRFQKKVMDSEFAKCSNLTVVYAPGGLEAIGDFSFTECGNLKKINMKTSPGIIGAGAFSRDFELTSFDLSGAYQIGAEAFLDCHKLESLNLSNHLTEIGALALTGCADVIYGLIVPGSLTFIPINSLDTAQKWVVLSEGCKEISYQGMFGCPQLRCLILPPGMRHVRDQAVFSYQTLDVWVYQPDMLIDDLAFYSFTPAPGQSWEDLLAKYPPPVIHGYPGSTAEEYAKAHQFDFVEITQTYEETVEAVKRMDWSDP